ncbi:mCG147810 [Mus musculus]|nr:mCG147810 [Mus musculus]
MRPECRHRWCVLLPTLAPKSVVDRRRDCSAVESTLPHVHNCM